ncbi:MAG TPA: 3-oxoacyl-[acyl-carrier-protein] synthase III C-terminal domain-containing protein [Acidobacteriaceae bacterium]|jgi:alkylresorcinol/alkylpyrone synthase|nr:3-oxoacyl-[acyl-carrier-protein] synthase III C-terminal domain-containing protein [Acidobacteriaceae bacterium]
MRIAGVATAVPKQYYTQQQILDELGKHWAEKLPNIEVLNRFHHRVGVEGRYLSLPIKEYHGIERWGQSNDYWLRVAEELGEEAVTGALAAAGVDKADVGAMIVVSVTGIASPSLDAHLINKMGLPLNMRRTPIFGLGCVAGAAGISQAADYVRAYPDRVAVLLSVELCSLTWQRGDVSVANLIASGLFGDGAAAVVICGDARPGSGPQIVATESVFFPDTEETMGWDISEEGFKIVLSAEVPAVIHKYLACGVDAFLSKHGLQRDDIGSWVMHTGGPKVLEATETALGLPASAFAASWESLRRVGNLSSASVLFVLQETMREHQPAEGTWGVLAAMGPGFCAELVLLRW